MTAVEKDRRGVLDKLLGNVRKTEGDDAFAVFAAQLEKLGINRKSYTGRLKGLLEDMLADAKTLAAKFTDDETAQDEMARQFVSLLMGQVAAVEDVDEVEPEEEMPPEDEEVIGEIMQEDGTEEDEEDEMPVGKELVELVINLSKETNRLAAMLGEMAEGYVVTSKFAAAAQPLIPQLQSVPDLQARIKELETAIATQKAMTPRQASKNNRTILPAENDSKVKDVIDEIRKGTEGNKVELGLKVKE